MNVSICFRFQKHFKNYIDHWYLPQETDMTRPKAPSCNMFKYKIRRIIHIKDISLLKPKINVWQTIRPYNIVYSKSSLRYTKISYVQPYLIIKNTECRRWNSLNIKPAFWFHNFSTNNCYIRILFFFFFIEYHSTMNTCE